MLSPEFNQKIISLVQAEWRSVVDAGKARRTSDLEAENEALGRMLKFNQEYRAAMKAEGRKFEAELELDPNDDNDKKVAQLLTAFRRGCMLGRLWNDQMGRHRIALCCSMKVSKRIRLPLEAMGRLEDLGPLLDDDDLGVRARAASWLKNSMPERCLPILEDILETQGLGKFAGRIAFWATGPS